jgi:hypothetical protein
VETGAGTRDDVAARARCGATAVGTSWTACHARETTHLYRGEANFEALESGVLQVWPRDQHGQEQEVYGPAEWLWVEVHWGLIFIGPRSRAITWDERT